MQALISPIPNPFAHFVKQMWADIQAELGVEQVWKGLLPHFTWQVCESYDSNDLIPLLDAICKKTKPFFVETTGFDHFDNDKVVLFNGIKPEPQLKALHDELWQLATPYMKGSEAYHYYHPELWHPHITIASKDMTLETMLAASELLDHWDTHWRFEVNRILLASQDAQNEFVTKYAFRLGEGLIFSFTDAIEKPDDGIVTLKGDLGLPKV